MLVPFGAGGGTDVPARFFAAETEKILGKNIVVSNVEGAGGTVGGTQLSQAAADGYNLGFLPVGTTTTQPPFKRNQLQRKQLDADLHGQPWPFYLVVGSDSPIASLDDYIPAADGPGIKFASAGPGSMAHVAQLTLDNNLRVTTQYIPSKGGGDIATEINGGRADAAT